MAEWTSSQIRFVMSRNRPEAQNQQRFFAIDIDDMVRYSSLVSAI